RARAVRTALRCRGRPLVPRGRRAAGGGAPRGTAPWRQLRAAAGGVRRHGAPGSSAVLGGGRRASHAGRARRHRGAVAPRRAPLGNVCTSDRGAGGRGGGRFTREGATKAELGGAELARAGTRPRGVFRSALACRRS